MTIENSIMTKGDRLSDWLNDYGLHHDLPLRFREFYRHLLRFVGIPEVAVVGRRVAIVAWGYGNPPNSVVLVGLTDAQMLRLCFDCSMLMVQDSDPNELRRLEMLRQVRKAVREGKAVCN
jgi:hypothetical protein